MTRIPRIATLAALAALFLPAAALAQPYNSEVVGFNTNPDVENSREMFRIPETSGSTAQYLQLNSLGVIDHNNSWRASGWQTEGLGAMNIFFDWADPNTVGAWARVTTIAATERPNPSLHLQGKVRFKIRNISGLAGGTGTIGICLGIRETGVDVPMLANGGTSGDIEWVGVTGVNDPNGANTPIPALFLPKSSAIKTVEFNLETGDVTLNGISQGGGIRAFTGDGVLSAPNNRGTLEHIALVNQAGNTVTRIDVHIDELQFESPVADPVLPPTVVAPIIHLDPTVSVVDIDPAADLIRLLRGGVEIDSKAPDPNSATVFTLVTPAQTGQSYTATQRVGAVTSAESAPVVVVSEPSPYGFSFVLDEDADDCGFNPPGGWEFVGASSLTGLAGGDLYPRGRDIFIDDSQWQTLDFSMLDPTVPWLGGNGTVDPSPNGSHSIDSIWWNVNPGGSLGPHEFFIDAVQVLDANDAVIDTIHFFEDGNSYMGNARGQSTVGATSGLSTITAFDGTHSHRVIWSYPDAVEEALGLYHNIGGACGTGPSFTDQGATIRFHVLARTPLDPNDLAIPGVEGPIVGAQSSVHVTNDATATAVQLYINGIAVDPNQGGVIDPLGATSVDFTGLTLNVGDSVSAKQTLGGQESRFAYPRGVAPPVPPAIATPVAPGTNSVTVINALDATFATASLVTVTLNNGEEVATGVPVGGTAVVTLTTMLQTGDTLYATQTVNGSESQPSQEVTVAFPAPIIYAAPAEGASSVRVQNLDATADSVTVRVLAGGDPNLPTNFTQLLAGESSFEVPVSGLVTGDTLTAFITVGAEDSAPTIAETVTVATATTILCDDFEDPNAYNTDWLTSTAPRLVSTSARNATIGGALSIYEDGSEGRVQQDIANLIPTATNPVVWNVAIYDTAGPGISASNQFAQLNGQVADFFYMHVGMSGPGLQPFLDTDYYQFRANSNGGPDWINLNTLDAPMRSVGWHVFTVIHKGDYIDVYVDGLLSAKNASLTATTTLDRARIGPGSLPGSTPAAYYDDYCVETGPVRFGDIASQPPGDPTIAAPIEDGDNAVVVDDVDPDVTLVEIVDGTLTVIGTATGPDPNSASATVALTRDLVHLESITARVTNAVGSASSAPLEVGAGNGDILIAIGIRETGDAGAIGSPGSGIGPIEFVGVSGAPGGVPQGVTVSPFFGWQTITFDPADPNSIAGFTGNGMIDGTRGTLEHLAITVDSVSANRSAGRYTLYIDNVVNVGAGAGGSDAVIADFEAFTVGDEVLFQEPTNSGSTSGNLTPLPSASEVSAVCGNSGKSELLVWFFKDTTSGRWIRITTGSALNVPQPIIDLTKPIRMDVLLLPEGALEGDLNNDGTVGLTDLAILLSDFDCVAPPACAGDVDGDGDTDLTDLAKLLAKFDTACP